MRSEVKSGRSGVYAICSGLEEFSYRREERLTIYRFTWTMPGRWAARQQDRLRLGRLAHGNVTDVASTISAELLVERQATTSRQLRCATIVVVLGVVDVEPAGVGVNVVIPVQPSAGVTA